MRQLRRAVLALLVTVFLCWSGVVGFLWANEAAFVYRTNRTRASATFEPPFSPFTLASTDGLQLDAVTLEHEPATPHRYWILYFNGAAGTIHRSRYRSHLEQLYGLGYDVMSFDYRGFGRNRGEATEAGLYDDALAAYGYLTRERKVDPSRIVLAGRSLGSAVAVEVATHVRSAGVVLLSPIDSVPLVGSRLYWWAPVRLLARNRFDALAKIPRITVPIVIAHALNDRFVPIAAGRSLYTAAVAPKVMLETGGGHTTAGFSPVSELAAALARFWPPPDGE
jgi:pimeloyl-ACP methyl ester carboxylesterase